MRVIAFMNQKGGVGKTTSAVNVGAALAEMGARVLLLDLDPQTNLTTYLGIDPDDQPDLYDVLCGEASFDSSLRNTASGIVVAAGSKDLAGADIELSGRPDRAIVLRNRMLRSQKLFDYVLLDCPPSLGLLTLNALAVAGEVVVPMQPHFLAMQGLAKLLETVDLVNRQINPRLRIAGIVLTMFDANTKLSAEVTSELETFLDRARGGTTPWSEARVFRTRIRRNIKLTESPSFGLSVLDYDSHSNGAADYRSLAREIATLRHTPSALERSGQPLPTQRSLVERAIDDADRQTIRPIAFARPSVVVQTNRSIDATKLAAARLTSAGPTRATSSNEPRERIN